MENIERYNHLNKYLKDKFGERTLKICVNGHFTCPNRDGTCGNNGCIFCSETGSGDHLSQSQNIQEQVKNYFSSYKATRANKFIVYFQNYTNTYDTLENLKLKYDSSLIDERIVGLQIATRPDCITEDICKLLNTYSSKYYVCVELGLQTSNDQTAKIINRGYTSKVFTQAVKLLNKYNIDIVTHIMVGLPNEDFEDIKNTVNFINQHQLQGIKIHSCYVVKNTKLAEMYLKNEYIPITFEEYMNSLEYILTHISKDLVIHRISGDSPKDLLLAPDWNLHKKWVLNGIDKILNEKDLWQGKYFNSN